MSEELAMRSARAWLRWRLAHALGRNPLVRVSDRLELAAIVLAVAVSIAMIPVACAVGDAVTETQAAATHADQGQAPAAAIDPRVSTLAAVGTEGVAIDDDYPRVSPPTTSQQVGIDGALAGMTAWVLVVSCAVGLVALVRRWVTRRQEASWDWDVAALLVGDDETDRHP